MPDLTPLDLEELKRLAEEAKSVDPDAFDFTALDALGASATPDVVLSLINQIEGMRAALVEADLKIRSFASTDQSDGEFIREVL